MQTFTILTLAAIIDLGLYSTIVGLDVHVLHCHCLAVSISCYKCLSINGSNPSCEDLFQGDIAGRPSLLSTPCFTRLRNRQGLFPATHCSKLVVRTGGTHDLIPPVKPLILVVLGSQSVQYTYRTCGRDEAHDNRITRSSHCGFVKLKWIDAHRRFRGCLHTCDRDACNRARPTSHSLWQSLFAFNLLFIIRSVLSM